MNVVNLCMEIKRLQHTEVPAKKVWKHLFFLFRVIHGLEWPCEFNGRKGIWQGNFFFSSCGEILESDDTHVRFASSSSPFETIDLREVIRQLEAILRDRLEFLAESHKIHLDVLTELCEDLGN